MKGAQLRHRIAQRKRAMLKPERRTPIALAWLRAAPQRNREFLVSLGSAFFTGLQRRPLR